MIPSATSSALAAIAAGQHTLQSSAQTVASTGVADMEALTEALVGAQQATHQIEAGVNMIATANEMLGSILDVYA